MQPFYTMNFRAVYCSLASFSKNHMHSDKMPPVSQKEASIPLGNIYSNDFRSTIGFAQRNI
jgi:hypothetical protein